VFWLPKHEVRYTVDSSSHLHHTPAATELCNKPKEKEREYVRLARGGGERERERRDRERERKREPSSF
jgi:hypothetical protein